MNIGTWNIQGLNTKKQEVFQIIEEYNMDIIALSETKKKGSGCEEIGKYIHIYSGVSRDKRAKRGVSIAIRKDLKRNIKSWESINENIIRVDIKMKGYDTTIIGVYAPTENANANEKEEFRDALTTVLEKISNRRECIVIGDLNARTGSQQGSKVVGPFGEREVNENGEALLRMCEEQNLKILNGYYQHKNIHKFTWMQATKGQKSIIDYVITRRSSRFTVDDVRVQRGAESASNHFLLRAKFHCPYLATVSPHYPGTREETNEIIYPVYNLDSLNDDSTKFLYKMRLAAKISKNENEDSRDLYNQLKGSIHEAAFESLGVKEKKKVKAKPWWWDEEVERLIKEKKQAHQKWLNTKDAEDRKLYLRISRDTKKYINKKNNEKWQTKCEEIDRYMGGAKNTESWELIKNLRKSERSKVNIQSIAEEKWIEYYSELFEEDREGLTGNDGTTTCVITQEQIDDITPEEVRKTIRTFKNGKAPGPGGICMELLKNAPEQLYEKLSELFNLCLNGYPLPEDWKTGYITSLHKKGSKDECANYRAITVLSSIGRVYAKILKPRIEEKIKEDEDQAGFRAGRSCADNTFTLRQLVDKRLACGLQTHLVFIDICKAYDGVPQVKMWKVMQNENIPTTYINAVRALYTGMRCHIKTGAKISEQSFAVTKGLRQGCCLAPTLFKMYLKQALANWKRYCRNMGIEVDGEFIYTLHYADDQVICAEDDIDISYMLRKLKQEYARWGLQINIDKTQYMVAGGKGEDLVLEDCRIKNVENYIYLGTNVTSLGGSGAEINRRMNLTRTAVRQLHPVIWGNKLSVKTKKQIYSTIVQSIATYNAEIWEVTKRQAKTINAVEMEYWRRSCGLTRMDRIPNDEIRRRMEVGETMVEAIERNRLKWYGHVKRMPDERWPKKMLEWTPNRRRKRGRPKTTWMRGVTEAMENRGINEEDWRDRDVWKRACEKRRI